MTRDGHCRLWRAKIGSCSGDSEWAHLGEYRRYRTRGRPPEERHTTVGSLMMCDRHHDDYDLHRLDIWPVTAAGADGPLLVIDGDTDVARVV